MKDFKTISDSFIPFLKAHAIEICHEPSGSRIFHISCPDKENCFCITVPTPPPDDTGMPHILEHMSLAGSEKFRCKEPFFEMIKRSCATFINAMTGNDITYYPVSSTVKTDLFNLADVYFDAVFHPLLSETTFAREAYHLAPEDPEKPLGDLRYDGIVYSEMKGVFSSPEGILERDSIRKLLPDTCHGKESGGNPESIPSLTLEQLRAFHGKNYHPSNTFIVLYGDIPTEEWLKFLAPRLEVFSKIPVIAPPVRQKSWTEPKVFNSSYPLPKDEEKKEKTYLCLNWLIGDTTDLDFNAKLGLLSYLLVGNDGAPLKKAIVDSHLGANLILAGQSPNGLEMTFHLGIDGSEPDRLSQYRTLVLETLDEISKTPFSNEDIDAAFQQVIYGCTEIGNNFALNTALNAATAWCAGLSPCALLDKMPYYEKVRKEISKDPMVLSRLIRKLFIDNPHRLDIVLAPSHTVEEENNARLKAELKAIRSALSDDEVRKMAEFSDNLEKLNQKPNTPEDLKTLPSLKVSDISPIPQRLPVGTSKLNGGGTFVYTEDVETNDIVYLILSFDISDLPEELWEYVPRFTGAVSDFGTKSFNYALTAKRRASCTGSLSADCVSRTSSLKDKTFRPSIDFSLKTTASSLDKALDVLREAIFELDPCDRSRMVDILIQDRAILRSDFVQDARSTTRIHSARMFSLSDFRKNQTTGLPQLALLEHLSSIKAEEAFEVSSSSIAAIRDFLLDAKRLNVSLVGPASIRSKVESAIGKWSAQMVNAPKATTIPGGFIPSFVKRNEGLSAALQVSFSALTAPAPHISSDDSMPFSVAASIISSDFMLPEIRFKGNAYGAGLTYVASSGNLIFSSYRDPHVAETYETIFKSIDFIKSAQWDQNTIDNAILTIARSYEQPIRPTMAASRILHDLISSVTDEMREARYRKLLSLKAPEVRETGIKVLEESLPASAYCVAASATMLEKAAKQIPNLTIESIIK